MNTIVISVVLLSIVTMILVIGVLVAIQKKNEKGIKKQLENLEIEKNKIDSIPIVPELTKIESLNKNEKLDAMYNNWKERLDVIRTNQIPKITDMLLDADYSLSKQDYKSTIYKIAKLEMEIYKVRTNSDFLLNEIKEITSSEERNRAIITNLKSKYRDLYQKYNEDKGSFGDVVESIDLQFENIAKRFETFETTMENNDYTEIPNIIKSLDEMLKHMENVIQEMPSIYLMTSSILPKKIDQAMEEYNTMVEEGFPLDYLNVEYNVEEAKKKISDIKDRSKVLILYLQILKKKRLIVIRMKKQIRYFLKN